MRLLSSARPRKQLRQASPSSIVFRLFQVERVEALGEPVVDGGEEVLEGLRCARSDIVTTASNSLRVLIGVNRRVGRNKRPPIRRGAVQPTPRAWRLLAVARTVSGTGRVVQPNTRRALSDETCRGFPV